MAHGARQRGARLDDPGPRAREHRWAAGRQDPRVSAPRLQAAADLPRAVILSRLLARGFAFDSQIFWLEQLSAERRSSPLVHLSDHIDGGATVDRSCWGGENEGATPVGDSDLIAPVHLALDIGIEKRSR